MAVKAGTLQMTAKRKITTSNPPLSSNPNDDEESEVARDLRMLRAILNPSNRESTALTAQPRRPKTAQAPAPTARASQNVKTPSHTTKHGKAAPDTKSEPPLSIPQSKLEQKKFATHRFNSSLKILSAVAKKRQATLQARKHEDQVQVKSGIEDEKGSQARCHAECASAALDVLRQHAEIDQNTSDGSTRQRERGAILLLEKCVSLEIKDVACEEACKIHDQYWKRQKGRPDLDQIRGRRPKADLADILRQTHVLDTKEDFDFTCALQSQLLRLSIICCPSSVTPDLLHAVSIDTQGSPADVVLCGSDAGFLSPEKTGETLQTIAQALSKLYTTAIKTKDTAPTLDSLLVQLVTESVLIKIASTRIVGKPISVDNGMRSNLVRAIKLYWHDRQQKCEEAYAMTRKQVQRIEALLAKYDVSQGLPESLHDLLAQLAELNNDSGAATVSLEKMLSRTSGFERWSVLCRLATNQLKTNARDISTMEDLLQAFRDMHWTAAASHPNHLLLLVVRLRNACFKHLTSSTDVTALENAGKSRNLCLKLLVAVLQCCTSLLYDESMTDTKLHDSMRVAVYNTVETIADAESCITSASQPIQQQYLSMIDSCLSALSPDQAVARRPLDRRENGRDYGAMITAMKIKLSNILWRAHVNLKDQPHAALDLATKSVSCLDGIRTPDLNKAALGPRLEKLADLQLSIQRPDEAKGTLKQAIDHYIAIGALADAVETSLSNQSTKVWSDTSSLAYQLGRSLRAYNTLATASHADSDFGLWTFDDEKLTEIHRAVLLEHQIINVVKRHGSRVTGKSLLKAIQLVLSITAIPPYWIWRKRLTANFSFLLRKGTDHEGAVLTALVDILDVGEVSVPTHPESFLSPYAPSLVLMVLMQRCLIDPSAEHGSIVAAIRDCYSLVTACNSSKDLDGVIDDQQCFKSVLHAFVAQVLALQEYEIAAQGLELEICLTKYGLFNEGLDLANLYISLARCQVRLDRIDPALEALIAAEGAIPQSADINTHLVQYHLVSAEIYLASSALEKCSHCLSSAATAFQGVWRGQETISGTKQIERDGIIAQAALLASQLACRKGFLAASSRFARQATKISISIWAALEKRSHQNNVPELKHSVTQLAHDFSSLDVRNEPSQRRLVRMGVVFWPYLDLHISSIKTVAGIVAQAGLVNDAFHYLKLLENASFSMSYLQPLFCVDASLALLHAKARHVGVAKDLVVKSIALHEQPRHAKRSLNDLLSYAEACVAIGEIEFGTKILQQVSGKVGSARIASLPGNKPKTYIASNKAQNLRKAKASRAPTKTQQTKQRDETFPFEANVTFQQMVNEDRHKALTTIATFPALEAQDVEQLEMRLTNLLGYPRHLVQECFALAKVSLAEAWNELRADSMQSVLSDSAIALPFKSVTRVQSGRDRRVSFLQARDGQVDLSSVKDSSTDGCSHLSPILRRLRVAHKLVHALLDDRRSYCSTDMIHDLVDMEARISLLLTTMNFPFALSSTELVLKYSQPKATALERENMVAFAEAATQTRSTLAAWPALDSDTAVEHSMPSPVSLNDLPSSWSIISIGLASSRDELLVSKVLKGRSPFLVRIPLHRANEEETEDGLTYDEVKNDMRDLISQASQSSHDPRGTSDKVARAEWHADRELLDSRLEDLLQNMESIWLGGFRGILSPHVFEQKQIAQFRKALASTLDKHLPSRQKHSSDSRERFDIHDHIIQTFLGLGDPHSKDLDDEIMDLLYFVVDILQFNGERNAYDEVDWDGMIVDILDALRSHYGGCPSHSLRHTILILDKEVECFPWEALPCLIEHPVSRMPSLSSIFERVSDMYQQSDQPDAFAITKSAANGSYILNPSGDLVSTQSTFEPLLAKYLPPPQHTPLVQKPPDENQFRQVLAASDVVLYFGHGSGAQYVRPRTIRSLDKCAVTLLFGCSSAKMTEHGVFESTGMPRAYMLGRAPAMVGCLWDVTDREIDRVALKTISEWGLVDKDDPMVKEGLKKRGRKGNQDNSSHEPSKEGGTKSKTLVEAVAHGRRACTLRYLCGAAVVVYGVPVVLVD